MTHYVYCMCYDDGSYYIGQTVNIKRRTLEHGRANEYFILEETGAESIDLLETMWIQLYKTWGLQLRNGIVFSGAGRKRIDDKAVRFILYPRSSWLEKLGKDEAKKTAEDAIEQKAKKKLKK